LYRGFALPANTIISHVDAADQQTKKQVARFPGTCSLELRFGADV
jgi:hypothetical protein